MLAISLPSACKWSGATRTVAELSDTNKSSHILIKDLESTTVLLRLTGLTETTGAVEDFQEGVEVN